MSEKIITEDTSLKDVLEMPDAAEILMNYGLLCAGCPHAGEHTLKRIKDDYGLSEEDIKEILKNLNKLKEENGNKQ